MKKTIDLNISGIAFHLDEDAYAKLKKYLDEINKHFSNKKGHADIINDIENRIAELFQQKLSAKKQVISIEDVEEVIGIMGHPSDFDHDSEEEYQAPKTRSNKQRRLYRNPDDRLLGGVCSGLGGYFNIDTVWVRLAFFIAIWLGGVSVLVYLILWIIIPPARTVAEKLEMQGDPVTIANIEKSIREEVNEIKDKLEDLTEQAKQTFRKKT